MTKKLRMLLIPALMSGLALGTTGCKADLGPKYEAGNPVKIGLICLHDNSSTYDKNFIDSMAAAVANLGDRVAGDAIIKTGVDESKDAFDAAKDLVKQGCNVIFADSFGHEPFILEAAQQYKNLYVMLHNKLNIERRIPLELLIDMTSLLQQKMHHLV